MNERTNEYWFLTAKCSLTVNDLHDNTCRGDAKGMFVYARLVWMIDLLSDRCKLRCGIRSGDCVRHPEYPIARRKYVSWKCLYRSVILRKRMRNASVRTLLECSCNIGKVPSLNPYSLKYIVCLPYLL